MFTRYITITLLALLISCDSQEKVDIRGPLETVLASQNPNIKRVMDSVHQYAVQIKFSQIDRKNGGISFKDYDFQVDSSRYFYPASTVKFPIALLTLSKLGSMDGLDRNTKFYVEGDTVESTFAREIEKIFAVSDNQSYNRLFEFLGQNYINSELTQIPFGPVRISHRVSTPDSDEITTRPLIVYQNDSTTTTLPNTINTSAKSLTLTDIQKGLGYMDGDSLVREPFDFSLKNYYPIETQHQVLKTVMFPEKFQSEEKIHLSPDQLDFVHTAMRTLPKNTGYDAETYYDGYCKFFMYGDLKENIPEHIKIYNKVGDAYGTLTDCAYIQDTKNNIEFLLTATIMVNKNAIFNDNDYEYDEIGFPFLAELGRELYNYELNRK
ncbi:serine hydrolase [Maribacter algarum]|uniref:Serine hydrolase n=1 Tax=Maribacter algarum (ex Zhang et al. 2020) TaxID=2578118 RepID=A0A5S3PGY4_9FLAO|nr:serine hydrolase [Maribacter algarum]TMM53367.1 serine hydrolase [Maribacter algarum]